jgi:hypothetical protein
MRARDLAAPFPVVELTTPAIEAGRLLAGPIAAVCLDRANRDDATDDERTRQDQGILHGRGVENAQPAPSQGHE